MTLLSISGALRVGTLAGLALAASAAAQPSGHHFETTPGPRGMVQLVPNTPPTACKATHRNATYKFVLPPNGRAGAYFVKVKQDCQRQLGANTCECSADDAPRQD